MTSTAHPLPTIHAYLGGSFDPPHFGHWAMMMAVIDTLNNAKNSNKILDFVAQFVPTKANPFKQHQTATHHRLAMLGQLIEKKPIKINTIETDSPSDTPSFTADTLAQLTAHHPSDTHIWIMGLDSLLGLPTWKNYQNITNLANLWVFVRNANQDELGAILAQLPVELQSKISFNINDLFTNRAGVIVIDNTPIPTISSTDIRTALKTQNDDKLTDFVPLSIINYANTYQLYN